MNVFGHAYYLTINTYKSHQSSTLSSLYLIITEILKWFSLL